MNLVRVLCCIIFVLCGAAFAAEGRIFYLYWKDWKERKREG